MGSRPAPVVRLPPERESAPPSADAWLDRLGAGAGWALDRLIVAAARRLLQTALAPGPADVEALRAALAAFTAEPLLSEPRRYFEFVERAPDRLVSQTDYRRRLRGGRIVGRRFASAYRRFGAAAADPDAAPILLEHWMHADRAPRATLLALHGFGMGQPRLDAWALLAPHWFARGLDVALLTLPFHGARARRGARFSGQHFADPDPARLNEAVRCAVYEMHAVAGWLQDRAGAPVGLLGLSLGGFLCALLAGLRDDLAFVIPMAAPSCLGSLALHFTRASDGEASAERRARALPYGEEELRGVFRVHSPLTYPARVAGERLMIIAGRGDCIVPPEHAEALWRHWGRPRLHWFAGSHLAPFGRAGIVAAVTEHLRDLDLLG